MTFWNYICIETMKQFSDVLELYLYWNHKAIERRFGTIAVLKLYLYLNIL